MDEKDGAFTDDFNKLSINLFNNNERSPFENNNGFDLNEPNSLDSDDTTDSMHKDILSKLNLR